MNSCVPVNSAIGRPDGVNSNVGKNCGPILVVEDNEANLRMVVLVIKKLGIPVTAVRNGLEALEAMQEKPYMTIFMDCQMPGMDGYETSRQIRRRYPNLPIRIIALTAHVLPDDKEKCFAAGMDDYLPKPVKVEDIRNALNFVEE